ncbi:hypothetical protein ScPMuIL_015089 [Solemya velum]
MEDQEVDQKVAVITGGNAGLGLTVAERLLTEKQGLRLCLACRNRVRAEAAKDALKLSHPGSDIDIIILDTSNVHSVFEAAKLMKEKYKRLDYLFLNAGIMSVSKVNVNWDIFFKTLFTRNCFFMFKTGDGILNQSDEITGDELMKIFATNVFGHFILIRELEDCIGGKEPSQLIWTSSSNGMEYNFQMDDIQHKNSYTPYSSSKYATDLLSIALNEKLNSKSVYSYVMCPGMVITNLTYKILPPLFWMLIWPIVLLMRIFVPGLNYSTYNGSEATMWLCHQKHETLSPRLKYQSKTGITGSPYVTTEKIKPATDAPGQLYDQLEVLYQQFKQKHKSTS